MAKAKVLLVEDDPVQAAAARESLIKVGYDVLWAEDGINAIKLVKSDKPDIILLDVIMPLMDGFTALAEIKKDLKIKNIPVIMLTNLGTDEDKAKGEKMGAVDYIVKSNFTPTQVSEKIKEHLK